jgi:hypothetical protein
MKRDSTKAFGLHGFSVGSAPMGIVTVPPATGALAADDVAAPDGAGPDVGLVHAETARAAASRALMNRADEKRM